MCQLLYQVLAIRANMSSHQFSQVGKYLLRVVLNLISSFQIMQASDDFSKSLPPGAGKQLSTGPRKNHSRTIRTSHPCSKNLYFTLKGWENTICRHMFWKHGSLHISPSRSAVDIKSLQSSESCLHHPGLNFYTGLTDLPSLKMFFRVSEVLKCLLFSAISSGLVR